MKIAPATKDSPAEPIVWTILFSSIESRLKISLRTPIEITAAGIDAETVSPTLKPKYALAAPKITEIKIPRIIAVNVSSFLSFILSAF